MPERGFLHYLAQEPMKAALAGAAGGLVRWITLRDNWREGALALTADRNFPPGWRVQLSHP